MDWQVIVPTFAALVLAISGCLKYYRRFKKVIREIDKALEDDSLSLEELRSIIAALLHKNN